MKIGTLISNKGKNYFYTIHLSYNGNQRKELWDYAGKENPIGLDAPGIVRKGSKLSERKW